MTYTIDIRPIMVADFERSRQDMLLCFRMLASFYPELAAQEAEATLAAMRQLFQMETAHG